MSVPVLPKFNRLACGVLALIGAATASAAAPVDTAIKVCTTAGTMSEAKSSLEDAGFTLVTETDADPVFLLSMSPKANTLLASQASDGLTPDEAQLISAMLGKDRKIKGLKAKLAAQAAMNYPEMIDAEGQVYVKVYEGLIMPRASFAVTCEITSPASETLVAIHESLPATDLGGFAADRIDERASIDAARTGGAAMSRRHFAGPFEEVFGERPAFEYQLTVISQPANS